MWRLDGELRCTAIVKATFAMPETGEMTRVNPQPIRRTDDYMHGVPSLAGAAETAPRLAEAGAVVIGHAYSPLPEGTKKRSVRFTIVRKNTLLVDKTLYVYGDRVQGGSPKRFTRMHIGYERALGGLDFSRNPVGVGMDKGSTARPNIIHPRDPKRAVGGYGPIPAKFPRRRRKLGDVKPSALESGIPDLPSSFNWDYFQAAPRDQRLPRLRGDEWVMLEGMHPKHGRLRVRIPKARAFVRVYQRKNVAAPELIELVCDTLHIEPDDDRCSLVWRADFPLASELAASALVLAGTVLEGPAEIAWPSSIEELEQIASPAQTSKALGKRSDSGPLFSTALSPGVGAAATSGGPPPPPPRRQHRTPPPPMPPPSVPPPPAWQKVARPSWNEFPAVSELGGGPGSGAASDYGSGVVSSGLPSSGAYPSYPGATPPVDSEPGWNRAATQYQAPLGYIDARHVPAAPPAAAPPAAAPPVAAPPVAAPPVAAPPVAAPRATVPLAAAPPFTRPSPTGTIPAPPPDEPVPDPFHPFETTDEIGAEPDELGPLEKTDPMRDDEDDSEWTQTLVEDEESDP